MKYTIINQADNITHNWRDEGGQMEIIAKKNNNGWIAYPYWGLSSGPGIVFNPDYPDVGEKIHNDYYSSVAYAAECIMSGIKKACEYGTESDRKQIKKMLAAISKIRQMSFI